MAIIHGDTVIPAGSFSSVLGAASLSSGSLCPDGLNLGTVHADGGDEDVIWNNGLASNHPGPTDPRLLRKCTAYTGTNLLGETVQLINRGSAFRGPVVQQLNTELDMTGGNGTQVPILVVKGAGFFFVVEPAQVEVV
jgi:hypothetical protein